MREFTKTDARSSGKRTVGTKSQQKTMADDTPRCLFEQADGSFCWEAVAALGQHCARHTRVVEVPVVELPAPRVPVGAQAWFDRAVQQARELVGAMVGRPALPDEQRCVAIMRNGQRCSAHRKGRTTLCGTHKNWTPLVQCAARVGRGDRRHQCHNNARPGHTMCGIHKAQEPEAPAVPAPEPAPARPPPVDPAVPCCRVLISSRNSRNYGKVCGLTRNLLQVAAGPGAQPEHCCASHISKRKRELSGIWRALDIESIRAVSLDGSVPGIGMLAYCLVVGPAAALFGVWLLRRFDERIAVEL